MKIGSLAAMWANKLVIFNKRMTINLQC
jgi:hypothetical protein